MIFVRFKLDGVSVDVFRHFGHRFAVARTRTRLFRIKVDVFRTISHFLLHFVKKGIEIVQHVGVFGSFAKFMVLFFCVWKGACIFVSTSWVGCLVDDELVMAMRIVHGSFFSKFVLKSIRTNLQTRDEDDARTSRTKGLDCIVSTAVE